MTVVMEVAKKSRSMRKSRVSIMWLNCTHRSASRALVHAEPPFSSASLGPSSFPPNSPGSFCPVERAETQLWSEKETGLEKWEVGPSAESVGSADFSYRTGGWVWGPGPHPPSREQQGSISLGWCSVEAGDGGSEAWVGAGWWPGAAGRWWRWSPAGWPPSVTGTGQSRHLGGGKEHTWVSQVQRNHQAPLFSVSHTEPFLRWPLSPSAASADLASSPTYPASLFFLFSFFNSEVGAILMREVPLAGCKSFIMSRKTL